MLILSSINVLKYRQQLRKCKAKLYFSLSEVLILSANRINKWCWEAVVLLVNLCAKCLCICVQCGSEAAEVSC